MRTLVWFRRDLRLGDNPAWSEATRTSTEVIPVFVIDPELWDRASHHRKAMLAANLRALDASLAEYDGRLHVVRGRPVQLLPELADHLGTERIHWNADYTPYARRRDDLIGSIVPSTIHHGQVVHAPGSILTNDGGRYRVFTPFYRRWEQTPISSTPAPAAVAVRNDPGRG
ncbi:MAG: deoxyribodipyrimidine photo-lyase, partial [Acidimicrobiia bacterium]|nr:deoxyribodipyrimidine photo-lyase [Acidimicrobiia bacterium]